MIELLLDELFAAVIDNEVPIAPMSTLARFGITPDEMRGVSNFHERLMTTLYQVEDRGLIADRAIVKSFMNADDADRIDEMMTRKSKTPVNQIAYVVRDVHLARIRNDRVLEHIRGVLSTRSTTPTENMLAAISYMQSQLTGNPDDTIFTPEQAYETWLARQRWLQARLASGLAVGPNWPWQLLTELVPALVPGELISLMGKSKWGKSLIGGVLSEHWGWAQNYDVYVFLYETTIPSYMQRSIARNCHITVHAQRTGMLNVDDRNHPAFQILDAFHRRLVSPDVGRIHFIPCSGWTKEQVESAVAQACQRSRALGREPVFIWDYFQKMDVSPWKHLANPFNHCAVWLKSLTETRGIYSFCLLQEKEDFMEPAEGFGIIKNSQVFMRIARQKATEDVPMWEDAERTRIRKDTMGMDRYWQRAGTYSRDMFISVMYANDDTPGEVQLLVEPAMFRVGQSPHQDLRYSQFIKG